LAGIDTAPRDCLLDRRRQAGLVVGTDGLDNPGEGDALAPERGVEPERVREALVDLEVIEGQVSELWPMIAPAPRGKLHTLAVGPCCCLGSRSACAATCSWVLGV